MKVIHYIPSIDRASGGTTAYLQLLGGELGKLVELHVASHSSTNEVEIPNSTIHHISASVSRGMRCDWNSLLDEIKPDVVHVNCCWMPQCAFAQKWAQKKGYKVMLTPHGMLEPWIMSRNYWTRKFPALLLYQKAAIKKADMLHATAGSERDNLLKLGYNSRITVISNGIEVDDIVLKSSWKPTKKILFLSRVHVKKGIELLMESVAQLKSKMDGYAVIIAGEGEELYVRELKDKALQLGISSIFQFVGGVYGEEKWKLFREADFFVLPSFSENFGIVIAEALASGTPVITTQGTPWGELNSSECGWWINNTSDALTNAIDFALSLPECERKAMGLRGRQLIEDNYSIQMIARQMKDTYHFLENR